MKRIYTALLLLLNTISVLPYDIKTDTVTTVLEKSYVQQIMVSITNTEMSPLWIWVDTNGSVNSDSLSIRNHFFCRRKGEFSIYEIATDPNMSGSWWDGPTNLRCFTKVLPSGKTFTMVFFHHIKELFPIKYYLDKTLRSIRIYKNQDVNMVCSGLDKPNSYLRISYPYDIMLWPIGYP